MHFQSTHLFKVLYCQKEGKNGECQFVQRLMVISLIAMRFYNLQVTVTKNVQDAAFMDGSMKI